MCRAEPGPLRNRVDQRATPTRKQILVAAEELIAASGVEGFQIKDVAWAGFDAGGQPCIAKSGEELQQEAEDLIVAQFRSPEFPRL